MTLKRQYIIKKCTQEISSMLGVDLYLEKELQLQQYVGMILQIGAETKHQLDCEAFGEKLLSARTKANLTQQRLANAIKVSVQSICKYEAGIMKPSDENIKILSELLNTKF